MSEYWDDDWDYEICIWVQVDKSFEEFVASMKKLIAPISFDESNFSLGKIGCRIERNTNTSPVFDGVPEEEYFYLIKIPISTDLIWSAFDKPFAMGLVLTMKHSFRCKYLITADDDFFVTFSGSSQPWYINTRYRPWGAELQTFLEDQETIELSVLS